MTDTTYDDFENEDSVVLQFKRKGERYEYSEPNEQEEANDWDWGFKNFYLPQLVPSFFWVGTGVSFLFFMLSSGGGLVSLFFSLCYWATFTALLRIICEVAVGVLQIQTALMPTNNDDDNDEYECVYE